MDNENTILTALIAAISTVIVGLMSLYASQKDTGTPSQKEIYKSALTNVWEPLDRILSYQSITATANIVHKIETIISDNYLMIPPEFIKEFGILKQKDNIQESDFTKLRIITASYFNWMRKHLGYPSDRKKIKIEFTPRSRRDILLTTIGYGMLLFTISIVTIMTLLSVMMLYEKKQLASTDYLIIAAALLGVISMFHLTINQPKR